MDTSVTTTKKITVQEAYNSISGLTALAGTSVSAAADSVPIYQSSTGTAKRILVSDLGSVTGGTTLGTPTATTSGTAWGYTGIATGVNEIVFMFSGFGTDGTSDYLIQIGSGSYDSTSYLATSSLIAGAVPNTSYTTGYGITNPGGASSVIHGLVFLRRESSSANTWVASGVLSRTDTANGIAIAGKHSLSGALDRIRLTTVNGTDAGRAGEVNIQTRT